MKAVIEVKIMRGDGPSTRTNVEYTELEEHEIVACRDALRAAESASPDVFRARSLQKLADALGSR